jgi:hypothetical protein
MSEVGEARVRLGVTRNAYKRDLNLSARDTQRFGDQLKSIAAGVAAAWAGRVIFGGIRDAINEASRAQEVGSKFAVVYGQQADAMEAWAEAHAEAVGRSRTDLQAYLAEAQDTFVPLGMDADQAAEMSKEISKLAIDLASFNNVADEEAFRDLMSAMVGNHETVKKYGVIINEARLKQAAFTRGLDPKALTEQQKAFLRLEMLVEGSTAALGDAERTADSYANQQKRLESNWKDLSGAIGKAFLPAATQVTAAFNDWIVGSEEASSRIARAMDFMVLSAMSAGKGISDAYLQARALIEGFDADTAMQLHDETFKRRVQDYYEMRNEMRGRGAGGEPAPTDVAAAEATVDEPSESEQRAQRRANAMRAMGAAMRKTPTQIASEARNRSLAKRRAALEGGAESVYEPRVSDEILARGQGRIVVDQATMEQFTPVTGRLRGSGLTSEFGGGIGTVPNVEIKTVLERNLEVLRKIEENTAVDKQPPGWADQ